jgi:hypothetical protein
MQKHRESPDQYVSHLRVLKGPQDPQEIRWHSTSLPDTPFERMSVS